MATFNRVILLGNVCRDPELRYTKSGMAVNENTLALNDRRKTPEGEWIQETSFVDVTFWGKTAEVFNEYVTKGDPIFVEGRLKQDRWEKDGQTQTRLRVVVEKLQLLGRKTEGETSTRSSGGSGYGQTSPRQTSSVHSDYGSARAAQQTVQNQTRPDEQGKLPLQYPWSNTTPDQGDKYTDEIPF